jgi:hypothetical protein
MRWEEALKQKGRFEFSDLLEMAQLTDPQLKTLARVLPAPVALEHPHNRAALRLVAGLSAQQRMLGFGRQGVELNSFDERQRLLLRDRMGEAKAGWAYLGPKDGG